MSMTIVAAVLGSTLVAMPAAPTLSLAHAADRPASPALVVAFAPLWQPSEAAQRRAARRRRLPTTTHDLGGISNKSTEALEREVFGSPGVSNVNSEPMPSIRRTPGRDDDGRARAARGRARGRGPVGAQNDDEDDDDEDDDDGLGRARRAGASLRDLPPVIAPHMVSFALGTSLMGRNFRFDGPLQPESSFPRGGLAAELESFPLLAADGWFSRFGVGASFSTEIGSAGLSQADGGMLTYPVSERRWAFDIRYALPFADRFLVVPLLGYGRSGYDLERLGQPAPSTCTAAVTQVCLPDVQLSHLTIGFDARAALTPRLAITLGAAFLPGFGVGRGRGQLGSESDASARGFSGALGASFQLLDWLALRATIPVIHYGYDFNGRALSYHSASETYYGLVVGATVFAR